MTTSKFEDRLELGPGEHELMGVARSFTTFTRLTQTTDGIVTIGLGNDFVCPSAVSCLRTTFTRLPYEEDGISILEGAKQVSATSIISTMSVANGEGQREARTLPTLSSPSANNLGLVVTQRR